VTKTDSVRLGAWNKAVGWAARAARVTLAAPGTPMHVTATFQFIRPARSPARPYPVVRPDLDKVLRGLFDALTGIAYHDDAQVVSIKTVKVYGPDARTTIEVGPLDE